MALVVADRVKETTTTTGTGTVTLLGASTGYQSFSAIGNSNTTYYTIAATTGTEWEVGIGTYTSSGTTLSRDTVLSSSNSGSLVSFSAGTKDVFVNIAGGLKVEDPSIDLAVICALLSSYEDVPLPAHVCFAGEVGLNGEIRAVNRIEQRIAEAEKLGFEKIIVSKYNKKSFDPNSFKIQVVAAGQVHEVYQLLF